MAQVRLDGCPHVSATFPNRKDAKDWAQRVEYDLRQRNRGDAPLERHTMSELVDRYRREAMRPEWEDWYGRQLAWWELHLGDRYLDEIRPPTIAALRDRLLQEPGEAGRRRSNATVNRYLAALSALMTFGAREDVGWVLNHSVRGVTRLTEPRSRVRFLSRAADDGTSELHRLLDGCRQSDNPDLLDIVTLAILTGCRRSEIMALRFDWLRADGFSLPSEITKTREARFVPLIGGAAALVEKRVAGRAPGQLLLFSRGRQPRRFPRRAWLTALRRAGVENFRFHDLRHTHASYLAMAGSSTRELMDALGHRTPAMAVRYSHFSDEHKVRVAERLRDQLGDL